MPHTIDGPDLRTESLDYIDLLKEWRDGTPTQGHPQDLVPQDPIEDFFAAADASTEVNFEDSRTLGAFEAREERIEIRAEEEELVEAGSSTALRVDVSAPKVSTGVAAAAEEFAERARRSAPAFAADLVDPRGGISTGVQTNAGGSGLRIA